MVLFCLNLVIDLKSLLLLTVKKFAFNKVPKIVLIHLEKNRRQLVENQEIKLLTEADTFWCRFSNVSYIKYNKRKKCCDYQCAFGVDFPSAHEPTYIYVFYNKFTDFILNQI